MNGFFYGAYKASTIYKGAKRLKYINFTLLCFVYLLRPPDDVHCVPGGVVEQHLDDASLELGRAHLTTGDIVTKDQSEASMEVT